MKSPGLMSEVWKPRSCMPIFHLISFINFYDSIFRTRRIDGNAGTLGFFEILRRAFSVKEIPMDKRDWKLLDKQLGGVSISGQKDGVMVLTIVALFFAA
jgi:hypothetical protein